MVTYANRAGRWASRFATRVDAAELERLATGILGTIDEVSSNRWEAAVKRAADQPGQIRPEKIKALTDSFAREVSAAGAAAGVVAASPAFGTAATLLTATAELAWFTARAGDLISAFKTHAPELIPPVRAAIEGGQADLNFVRLNADRWAEVPAISFDYAVMERTKAIQMLPLDMEWNDVGDWPALLDVLNIRQPPDVDDITFRQQVAQRLIKYS